MEKYAINKEFFPLTLFTASLNPKVIAASRKVLCAPRFIWNDPELTMQRVNIPVDKDTTLETFVFTPKNIQASVPCMVDFHGGGFIFDAAPYHYRLAMEYAKGAQCAVVLPRYRLAPNHPFPTPQEDCLAALVWTYEYADELGIDSSRIGVGGDSAGGTLTVTTCLMARDRALGIQPLFQLLIYPWLDARNTSESYKRFYDVPVWNSSVSEQATPIINPNPDATPLAYRSPVEAQSLAGLPSAYIEVAEFDSLHDDGILYAELLAQEHTSAELHEVQGAIHGFDMISTAKTTKRMVQKRVSFMRTMFHASHS